MSVLTTEIELFRASAGWVGSLVQQIPDHAWGGAGLGGWDLRALVGHTVRALLTVEQYLECPASALQVTSPEEYFAKAARATSEGVILQRGIDAGAALGEDPVASFVRIVRRVLPLLDRVEDRLILTIAGGMWLSAYLPTRTFELVVHGLDIARSVGLSGDPPPAALGKALDLATALVLRSGGGSELLLVLTGRGVLRSGYSVLG